MKMKKFVSFAVLSLLTFLFASCNASPADPPANSGDYDEEELYSMLFAPENRLEIKLDIPDSELAKIQADYEKYKQMNSQSPIYRMADMYVKLTCADGKTQEWNIPQVGVRMKGNTSRCDFYSADEGMYNLIHFKISFGETFDKEKYYGEDALEWNEADREARKERTFATLENLDLKWNRNDDKTYIKEIYAYELYRESGVLAPYTTLASVDVGEDHAGVWTVYEPIDDIFLEKRLPGQALGGDLYKLGWTNEGATFTSFSSYGVEDEDKCQFFVYDLKTNKKTSTHQSLKELITTLNSGNLTKEAFAGVVDEENFVSYSAVSYIVGNPDDLRNNYNNCYIYFRADNGKMMIIPYDMDRVFGINTWNPYGDSMTCDSPFSVKNVVGEQKNPLFKTTLCSQGLYAEEYFGAVTSIIGCDMLTDSAFAARFNTAKQLYSDYCTPSKTYRNASSCAFTFNLTATCAASGNSNMSFSDYMSAKRQTVNTYVENGGVEKPDLPARPQTPDPKLEDSFDLCIRADFTDWNRSEEYKLQKSGEGIFSITLTRESEFRFKIHDDDDGKWYGAEWVDYDCPSYLKSDDHTNIVLPAGSYLVRFDINTRIIYIEEL
ncbi:MAG: CotH kinase family protein [Candidatus Coproplasma sp.]